MRRHYEDQPREMKGVPTAGRWVKTRLAEAVGVNLADVQYDQTGYDPMGPPEPVEMTDEDVMRILADERDILGLGISPQQEIDGVHVYHTHDKRPPVGVRPTGDGRIEIHWYSQQYPRSRRPVAPTVTVVDRQEANYQVGEYLEVNREATRLLARAATATEEEKALLGALFERANPEDNHVRDQAFRRLGEKLMREPERGGARHVDLSQTSRAQATYRGTGGHRDALIDAVYALQNRHRVGAPLYGSAWTGRVYDHFTAPIRQVFGQIHHDDEPIDRITPGFEHDMVTEGLTSDNPAIRRRASMLSRMLMAERLGQLRVKSFNLWAIGDQMGLDGIEIDGNPDPEANWQMYEEAGEVIKQHIEDFTSPKAIRMQVGIDRGGVHHDMVEDASRTFTVPSVTRDEIAKVAVEIREALNAQKAVSAA